MNTTDILHIDPQLGILVNDWLVTSQFAPKTRETYAEQIRYFVEYARDNGLELYSMNTGTATQYSDYVIYLISEDVIAASTGALRLASCKSLFKFAAAKGYCTNHFSHIRISQEHNRIENLVKEAMDWDQFYAIVDYYTQEPGETVKAHYARNKAVMFLAAITGARLSELRTMRLKDVTIDNGYIVCRIKGKGDRFYSRYLPPVPVDSNPGKEFLAWYNYRVEEQQYLPEGVDEGQFVFCSLSTKSKFLSLTREAFGRIVTDPLRKLGLYTGKVTFHSLRHLHGELIASTEGLHAAQLNLGHKSMSTTQRYAKEAIQRKKEQTQDRVSKYF